MIERIRNFAIIAHIDHGKSTLADRLLEYTGTVSKRELVPQYLDKMDIERERGITIKSQTVRMEYKSKDNKSYILNLIDTPGHVDFTYEVSRSLYACEGALLVVDACQGVEAQTISNAYMAIEADLKIVPVINKIDLPNADPARVYMEIEEALGIDEEPILVSAKYGDGILELLEEIIKRIPSPNGDINAPLKALIFDSWFDTYHGVIMLVRVFSGKIQVGDEIMLLSTKKTYEVSKIGIFSPKAVYVDMLSPGEVGFVAASIKEIREARVGDTVTSAKDPIDSPFPGFKEPKPMVFCGLYPQDPNDYETLRKSLLKLSLNDSAIKFEPENSNALGFGFRCGFLGLLHMEVVQERLEREYGIDLVTTAPTTRYIAVLKNGKEIEFDNPTKLPDPSLIEKFKEPFVRMQIYLPDTYLGNVIKLCEERRGIQKQMKYLSTERVQLVYDLPFAEILLDFYDKLKSVSRGYASCDYDFLGFFESDLVKVDILVNGKVVDALSFIVHKEKAYYKGKEIVEKMKKLIPRHLFEIVIQAALGKRVIAKQVIKPLRKNVTAKCYGGDVTRKRKLLEKQKEGKKRMKKVGNVEIPQEAFLSILRV